MLTGKILDVTNKNELDFIKIKYQKEYSLEEIDNFVRKILRLAHDKKKKKGQNLNFEVKLIILDSKTKAIRFDMKKDERLKINASLPEETTTLRTLLEEEIEVQRYDMGNPNNFDSEKKKFLEDFDESYEGKVSKDLDEKAIGKGKEPFFKKWKNVLFKDNSNKTQGKEEQVTSVKDAFDDEEDTSSSEEDENKDRTEEKITQNKETAEEDKEDEEVSDESINELWDEKSKNENSSENQQSSQQEAPLTKDESPQDYLHKTNESESDRVQEQPPKNPIIPINIPKYTEKEVTLKYSDDPFEQKQNEYIYDRLLNKESYKAALYEELGHKLEYQFISYVNDKRSYIEKVKETNSMSEEDYENRTSQITQRVQSDIDQQIQSYEDDQKTSLNQFTQKQSKELENFREQQDKALTEEKEKQEKAKSSFLEEKDQERLTRIQSEQMHMIDESEQRINEIVEEEHRAYDLKIQDMLNDDYKKMMIDIDDKMFQFDDETYQNLMKKREIWKQEVQKNKDDELKSQQLKNEQLEKEERIKAHEAIIAEQKQVELDIKHKAQEEASLKEKNRESQLQLELEKEKNEKERLAQEERRIKDSEKQTSIREQELVHSKEKNNNMQQALMATYMTNSPKQPLNKTTEQKGTTPKNKEKSLVSSIILFLVMAVIFIGVFVGGLFADHFFHFLNMIPSSMEMSDEAYEFIKP